MITCIELANQTKERIKAEVFEYDEKPTLAIISNGKPDGQRYIRNKIKVAEELGIKAEVFELPNLGIEEFKKQIKAMNHTGIILQLPYINKEIDREYIEAIPLCQDVDGLLGLITPATAKGVFEYLKANNLIDGKNIVIIGRSQLVGMPLAKLLLNTDATVTLCHSKTKDLQLYTLEADVIISAVGKINFITKYHLWGDRDYHIVDVGINFDEDGCICGDVADDVKAMDNVTTTPVPRGVGLLTTAFLMDNLMELHSLRYVQEYYD